MLSTPTASDPNARSAAYAFSSVRPLSGGASIVMRSAMGSGLSHAQAIGYQARPAGKNTRRKQVRLPVNSRYGQGAPVWQASNGDATGVAVEVLKLQGYFRPVGAQREAIGPFDQDDGGLGKRVFEAQGFQVDESFNAVQVHVIDTGMIAKDVYQGERGAGDVLLPRGAQAADDTLAERGFAASQVAGHQDQHGRRQLAGEPPAELDGLLGGMRNDLSRRHGRCLQAVARRPRGRLRSHRWPASGSRPRGDRKSVV